MKSTLKLATLAVLALALLGQTFVSANSQSAARCQNVFLEGSAFLDQFGAPPQPMTLGNVPGMMGSVITGITTSGNGAMHLTLVHTFVSTDPARVGSFTTEDRAVCAPAGTNSAVCRVNDVLRIVGGTGIFTNANGSLRNHGLINFAPAPGNPFDPMGGSLTYSIRGRMCGDGL